MYHWFLIAVLFFGIATAAHALRICHSQVGRVAFVDSVDSVGFFHFFGTWKKSDENFRRMSWRKIYASVGLLWQWI